MCPDSPLLPRLQPQLEEKSQECFDWIQSTLNLEVSNNADASPTENLMSNLANGAILCQIAEIAAPGIKIKYSSEAEEKTFFARDNISNFLSALKKMALIESDDNRFEVEDIVNRRNDKIIVATIMKLARKAAEEGTAEPPASVAKEMAAEGKPKFVVKKSDDEVKFRKQRAGSTIKARDRRSSGEEEVSSDDGERRTKRKEKNKKKKKVRPPTSSEETSSEESSDSDSSESETERELRRLEQLKARKLRRAARREKKRERKKARKAARKERRAKLKAARAELGAISSSEPSSTSSSSEDEDVEEIVKAAKQKADPSAKLARHRPSAISPSVAGDSPAGAVAAAAAAEKPLLATPSEEAIQRVEKEAEKEAEAAAKPAAKAAEAGAAGAKKPIPGTRSAVVNALDFIRRGTPFLKYGKRGYPHWRYFQVSEDNRRLEWYSKGKRLQETSIELASIRSIVLGQTTSNFLRHQASNLGHTSFSLIYDEPRIKNVTLDVVAMDSNEFKLWCGGLQELIKLNKKADFEVAKVKEILMKLTVVLGRRSACKITDHATGEKIEKFENIPVRPHTGPATNAVSAQKDVQRKMADALKKFAKLGRDFPKFRTCVQYDAMKDIVQLVDKSLAKCQQWVNEGEFEMAEDELWSTTVDMDSLKNMMFVLGKSS